LIKNRKSQAEEIKRSSDAGETLPKVDQGDCVWEVEDDDLEYNEVDTFFCMIRIFNDTENDLGWRNFLKEGFPALFAHMDLLEEIVSTSYTEVYEHLTEEQEEMNLSLYFMGIIMTIFVSELQDLTPQIAVHIFDVFLIEGESLILTLLINFIKRLTKQILDIDDGDELQEFMKKELPKECLK
jgi:hypothetical protein